DAAEADEADRAPGDFASTGELVARPAPGRHGGSRRERAAEQNERRGEDVLGDRARIGADRRNHLDLACGTCVDIDVLEADAKPSHDGKPRRRTDEFRVDPRRIADDQRIGFTDCVAQLRGLRSERRLVADREPPREARDRALVHVLADDDALQVANSWSMSANALNSSALPNGSRKNIVACSPASPRKRT